jgi:hypothetical protein
VLVTLSILSAALTLTLSFLIADKASQFGFAVAIRFLERGDVIPPDNQPLTAENLDRWRSDPVNHVSAQGYASQIIPLDILFLLSLGFFFGLASMALANHIGLSSFQRSLLLIFPLLYTASDFIEDLLIRNMLVSPSLSAGNFNFMRRMTLAKMKTAGLCFLQVLSWWFWRCSTKRIFRRLQQLPVRSKKRMRPVEFADRDLMGDDVAKPLPRKPAV